MPTTGACLCLSPSLHTLAELPPRIARRPEVDARLAAFADLAERCQRYVREERAIARAQEAVLRADQALGDGPLRSSRHHYRPADRAARCLVSTPTRRLT